MEALYEPDTGSAYYRCSDPIKNLKIRLSLERLTSSNILSPQSNIFHKDQISKKESKNKLGVPLPHKLVECIEISWQQKIFSQREIEAYKNLSACQNVIEEKYNKDVNNILLKGKPTNRIFTLVDHDDFRHIVAAVQYMTLSSSEKPTNLSERMSHVRRRRQPEQKPGMKSALPRRNIIELKPSDEHKNQHHLSNPPLQTMYIMADLSPKERLATEREEVELCCIQLYSDGVISIKPDFNRGNQWYTVENQAQAGDLYKYYFEDVSPPMNSHEIEHEKKIYSDLYSRHSEFLQACVGQEFEMPSLDVLKVVVNGEIMSAKNFEYDDIYIQVYLDLPKNWIVEGHQKMSWVTQTCRTKVVGRDDVAYFSFPFTYEIFYKNDYFDEEKDELPKMPLLLIEVLSLDSWSRYRTEGYAYMTLPSCPGCYTKTLHCWRPVGTSLSSELRRFFIGGSPELDEITYSALPGTFEGSHLSKYALKTETTGEVTLNMNILLQSRSFINQKANKKNIGSLFEAMGISQFQANILNVIDAFKKAREKMIQTRESATLDLHLN